MRVRREGGSEKGRWEGGGKVRVHEEGLTTNSGPDSMSPAMLVSQ